MYVGATHIKGFSDYNPGEAEVSVGELGLCCSTQNAKTSRKETKEKEEQKFINDNAAESKTDLS